MFPLRHCLCVRCREQAAAHLWIDMLIARDGPVLALAGPLRDSEAERLQRHRVILRTLGLGTCSPVGSRVVGLLASVIDSCCQRGHVPQRYLEGTIADRRARLPLAHYLNGG